MSQFDDFSELRNKIELYLDNALDDKSQESLRHFVNNNPEVNQLFRTEHTFRQFVKNNISRPQITPDFIEALKKRLNSTP